jgi:hypothetical protein
VSEVLPSRVFDDISNNEI